MKKPKAAASRFAPDAQFQTNAVFDNLWPKLSKTVKWRGQLVRQHASIPGAWHVKIVEPEGLPVQVLNEKFMEVLS